MDLCSFGGNEQPLNKFSPRGKRRPEGVPSAPAILTASSWRPDAPGPPPRSSCEYPASQVVGADGHQRQVERSVVSGDLREALGVAGVTTKICATT